MTTRKRPEWAKRIITALGRSGLAEVDLERIVGAPRRKIARWLAGADVRSIGNIDALIAISDATGASMNWIVTGEETNALKDKVRIAQIRECLCREPIVDIEMARAVMRPDKRAAAP
jgi:hypothetical protein